MSRAYGGRTRNYNLYLRDCAQSDRKLSMKWE